MTNFFIFTLSSGLLFNQYKCICVRYCHLPCLQDNRPTYHNAAIIAAVSSWLRTSRSQGISIYINRSINNNSRIKRNAIVSITPRQLQKEALVVAIDPKAALVPLHHMIATLQIVRVLKSVKCRNIILHGTDAIEAEAISTHIQDEVPALILNLDLDRHGIEADLVVDLSPTAMARRSDCRRRRRWRWKWK